MVDTMLNQGLNAVEKKMRSVIDSDVVTLADASQHIIRSGGKRMRPQVAILSYLAAGGTDVADVVALASAVELVHTATLVHDDINDHSALRRGKVAVHARWGRTFALLTGDYMFAKVYEMMSPYGSRINQVMSTACVTLVEGETLQAAAAKSGNIDRETYKQIIERKTASLFRASAHMAGILAEADETVIDALKEYGHYLGITFQIVDDILDLIGDPEAMGKPVGLDAAQGRGVMVAQGGAVVAQGGTAVANGAVKEASDPLEAMMQKLRESGAADVARFEAERMAEKARESLDYVPPSPAKEMLLDLIEQVLERNN